MVTAININIDINTVGSAFSTIRYCGQPQAPEFRVRAVYLQEFVQKHYVAAGVSTFAFQGAGLPVLRWYPALALILVARIKRLNRLRRRFVNKVRVRLLCGLTDLTYAAKVMCSMQLAI